MSDPVSRGGVYRQQFATSNFLGIPDLLENRLWSPTERWQLTICGYTPLTRERSEGTVHGYWTDDFRFEATWNKPRTMLDKILNANVAAMVEPDFSTYSDDAIVCQMHAVYKARWVARFWQEYGVKVIPNIQWSNFESLRWSLLGIPLNAPIIAIEGRPRQRKDCSEWIRCAREACDVLQPKCVLLYGATAEMAEAIPGRVIAFTAASPRAHVPVRIPLNRRE